MLTIHSQNSTRTPTHAMAHNTVAWTDSSLRAFGAPTFATKALWWRQPGNPGIYLGAAALDDESTDASLYADLEKVVAKREPEGFVVYDCWASRDLTELGFERAVQNPWYLRPPGPLSPASPPEGLTIEVVNTPEELALFEEASRLGFEELETTDPGWEAHSWHHPATLDDPGMTYLVGKLHGRVVSGVILYATDGMLGIYGLSTLPQFRRRGYAAALVHASVAMHPELSASVFPDPPSVPMYTRIGFAPAGEIAVWTR